MQRFLYFGELHNIDHHFLFNFVHLYFVINVMSHVVHGFGDLGCTFSQTVNKLVVEEYLLHNELDEHLTKEGDPTKNSHKFVAKSLPQIGISIFSQANWLVYFVRAHVAEHLQASDNIWSIERFVLLVMNVVLNHHVNPVSKLHFNLTYRYILERVFDHFLNIFTGLGFVICIFLILCLLCPVFFDTLLENLFHHIIWSVDVDVGCILLSLTSIILSTFFISTTTCTVRATLALHSILLGLVAVRTIVYRIAPWLSYIRI